MSPKVSNANTPIMQPMQSSVTFHLEESCTLMVKEESSENSEACLLFK